MAFPSDSIACIGRNIEGMIDKYDSLSKLPFFGNPEIKSDLDPELVSYLKGADSEIRFYANKPQSFLTILTGAQLDLKLIDVKGSFVADPKHDNQYLLNLDFREFLTHCLKILIHGMGCITMNSTLCCRTVLANLLPFAIL